MVDVTRRTLCEGLMALSVLAITNTNVFAATARPRPNILFSSQMIGVGRIPKPLISLV